MWPPPATESAALASREIKPFLQLQLADFLRRGCTRQATGGSRAHLSCELLQSGEKGTCWALRGRKSSPKEVGVLSGRDRCWADGLSDAPCMHSVFILRYFFLFSYFLKFFQLHFTLSIILYWFQVWSRVVSQSCFQYHLTPHTLTSIIHCVPMLYFTSSFFLTLVLLPPQNLNPPLLCGASVKLLNPRFIFRTKGFLAHLHPWIKPCVLAHVAGHLDPPRWDRCTTFTTETPSPAADDSSALGWG